MKKHNTRIYEAESSLAARILGSIRSDKKAAASRENGKRGGYWKQQRNRARYPYGLNAKYEGVENSLPDTSSIVKYK